MNYKKIMMAFLSLVFIALVSCKQTPNQVGEKTSTDPEVKTFKVVIIPVENGQITCTKEDGSAISNLDAVPKDTKLVFVLRSNENYFAKVLIIDSNEYTALQGDGSIKVTYTLTKDIKVSGECNENPPSAEQLLLKEINELLEKEMVAVPVPQDGITCTLGYDDAGNDIDKDALVLGGNVKTFFVHKPFSIGKHEVSYKLFYDVRSLAEKKGYKFANKGLAGSDTGTWDDEGKIWLNEGNEPTEQTKDLPVTMVIYNDLVVWCNALSELMGKEPVYYKEVSFKTVLKDAGERFIGSTSNLEGAAYDCHNAKAKPGADGYRLPREKEWEVAAKWQGTEDKGNSVSILNGSLSYYWTKGNSFSGASEGYKNEEACKKVGWYKVNSNGKTHKIGEKTDGANALGLFDMSGNVAEFTASRKSGGHTLKGGSYKNIAEDCVTTYKIQTKPEERWEEVGFRLCCGVQGEVVLNPEPTDMEALLQFPTFTGNIEVPMNIDDSSKASIDASFKIGKYEVCNKLFVEVLEWALANGYAFDYEKKAIADEDKMKPVANVTWYDAIVWCNAYSEKNNLTPCYYDKTKTSVLKSSEKAKWSEVFGVQVIEGSTGYRLPTITEWVASARLRKDNVNAVKDQSFTSTDGKTYYFTKGNFISGASFNYDNEIEREMYCINRYNNDERPSHIGSKKPNALGAFDMSGNVWEWCFDHIGDGDEYYVANMGGGFKGDQLWQLSIGNVELLDIYNAPQTKEVTIGFRVVQNQ